MNQATNSAGMDLTALLAASLDDIPDLPAFEVPPAGYYKLSLSIDPKKINEKDAIEFSYSVVETLELVETTDTPPTVGTKFNSAFMIGNDIGLGKFKEAAKPVMEALGTTSYADILAGQVKDFQIFATLKRRKDKNDPERFYPDVSKITVA